MPVPVSPSAIPQAAQEPAPSGLPVAPILIGVGAIGVVALIAALAG